MTAFRRDSAGFAEVLKSEAAHRLVSEIAAEVAKNLEGQGITVGAFEGGGKIDLPVETETRTTDRAHADVTIAHPAGIAVQAKRGALTKAAAAAGLEVKTK